MSKILLSCLVVLVALSFAGCPPVERDAYGIVTGGKAALTDFRGRHPECGPFDPVSGLSQNVTLTPCIANNRLTSAKDAIVDAGEVYCAGKDFGQPGAPCNPPAKGSPGYEQAAAKLKAAIASYRQIERDTKGVFGK
jgi:hypothetical protein